MIHIYEKNVTTFTGMGIAALQPISAVVEEEINGAYTLTLEMPKDDLWCIQERIITAPTPKNGDQAFRIYCPVVDLEKVKVVYARHIFYDLLDNFIESVIVSGNGTVALNTLLNSTQYTHSFTGISTVSITASTTYDMTNPVSAMLDGERSIVSLWHGELERNNCDISMHTSLGQNRGVEIRYRKNLTGLNVKTDISNVFTRIMPTGVKTDNAILTIDAKYVDSPLIANYAHPKVRRIHYSNVKVSETQTEAQSKAALEALASSEFAAGCDLPKITAAVEFIPLQDTEEYKSLAVLETVYLGDTVTVKHGEYDVDIRARVVSYEYNALTQKYIKVIIGSAASTFGQNFSSQLNELSETVNNNLSNLEAAINHATELLTSAMGGYVVKKQGEILIMDTEDEMTATKVWRWNLNGLGYSSTGVNGPYSMAMTMDGEIVASLITAGILRGDLLESGSVDAGKISQTFKNEIASGIADGDTTVTQAFTAGDAVLDSKITESLEYVDETLLDYVKSSELEQTVDAITMTFSEKYAGGMNCILNSAGLNGKDSQWSITGTAITFSSDWTRGATASNSAFRLSTASAMEQVLNNLVTGRTYMFSCMLAKTSSMNAKLNLNYNGVDHYIFNASSTIANWTEYTYVITDLSSDTLTVRLSSDGNYLYVTDMMLYDGSLKKAWTPAPNEIYTDIVKIDKDGIRVSNTTSNTSTVINNEEFAVIYGEEKVITVNKDETLLKKSIVDADLTIGKLKFLPLENYSDGVNIILLD